MGKREPDFSQILKVVRGQKPDRPTLFEFFMNMPLYERVTGRKRGEGAFEEMRITVDAFRALGYDYAFCMGSGMRFDNQAHRKEQTISLNDGCAITDWASFERFSWPDPEAFDFSNLERIKPFLPDGMKLMVAGPGGILENAIALMGYDNLCVMLFEEPELVRAVFDGIGRRMVRYYEIAMQYDAVGLLMSNDDWGFNSQTFLSPAHMRELVFPWHRRIVETAHSAGRCALLHSCGYMNEVMEDIIEDMRYDAKHSFEDKILPIEESYKRWGGRIALLGGIDLDFLIRSPIPVIQKRCRDMLSLAQERGGYALGSGNSIPEYVPVERYLAMIDCAMTA